MNHPLPPPSSLQLSTTQACRLLDDCRDQLQGILLGKTRVIDLSLVCILAGGHLLLEDLPGMGKTTFAQGLARVLGLGYRRLQFTSDLLPADITGASIFDRESAGFIFRPGPVFTHVLLADEINRAPPKSQSALLEAMEEQQVSCEGNTYALNQPFFVIATQNPLEQQGTFVLPESQLDRFLLCTEIGYPDALSERQLLTGHDRRKALDALSPRLDAQLITGLQQLVAAVHVADAVLDYTQALLAVTRQPGRCREGLSPRAGLALLRAAKAWALLQRRDYVLPEDLQAVWLPLTRHRLQPMHATSTRQSRDTALVAMLQEISVS